MTYPHVFGDAGDDGDIAGGLPDAGRTLVRTAGARYRENGAPLPKLPPRPPHFTCWEATEDHWASFGTVSSRLRSPVRPPGEIPISPENRLPRLPRATGSWEGKICPSNFLRRTCLTARETQREPRSTSVRHPLSAHRTCKNLEKISSTGRSGS